MSKTWVISDTHFGHANILTFRDSSGDLIRPGFKNIDEHDQLIIDNWNSVVKPEDRVYHLGDVAIPRRGLKFLYALNGRKALIGGNHDIWKVAEYEGHFDYILGSKRLNNLILTHIPVQLSQFERFSANVHGHIHQNLLPDPRYVNLCVEHTGYRPVELDEIIARVEKFGKS